MITTSFDVVEAASLPTVTSAQQAELCTLKWACTLAKDKTARIYTDSRNASEVAYDFGILWNPLGFLTFSERKLKMDSMVRNY